MSGQRSSTYRNLSAMLSFADVSLSPQLCRGDRLVGMVLGAVGSLPDIYIDLEINYFLLRRLLGVKTTDKKQAKVAKLTKGEVRFSPCQLGRQSWPRCQDWFSLMMLTSCIRLAGIDG